MRGLKHTPKTILKSAFSSLPLAFLALQSTWLPTVGASPVQLVDVDRTTGDYVLTSRGEDMLRSMTMPQYNVVSVVGRPKSGKSFLINQLVLGEELLNSSSDKEEEQIRLKHHPDSQYVNENNAIVYSQIPVGGGMESLTMGLWGDVIHENSNPYYGTLYIETESLNRLNGEVLLDMGLFSIAAMLSTEMVYNFVRFVDKSHVREFSMYMMAAQRLVTKVNSIVASAILDPEVDQEYNMISEFQAGLPTHVTWLIRDFTTDLKGEDPISLLKGVLQNDDSGDDTTLQFNGMPFPTANRNGFDVVTLPTPTSVAGLSTDLDRVSPDVISPEFTDSLMAFQREISARRTTEPRTFKPSGTSELNLMTNEQLVRFAKLVIRVANEERRSNMHGALELREILDQDRVLTSEALMLSLLKYFDNRAHDIDIVVPGSEVMWGLPCTGCLTPETMLEIPISGWITNQEFVKRIDQLMIETQQLWLRLNSEHSRMDASPDSSLTDVPFRSKLTLTANNLKAQHCSMISVGSNEWSLDQIKKYHSYLTDLIDTPITDVDYASRASEVLPTYNDVDFDRFEECKGVSNEDHQKQLTSLTEQIEAQRSDKMQRYLGDLVVDAVTAFKGLATERNAVDMTDIDGSLWKHVSRVLIEFDDEVADLKSAERKPYREKLVELLEKERYNLSLQYSEECLADHADVLAGLKHEMVECMHYIKLPLAERIIEGFCARCSTRMTERFYKEIPCAPSTPALDKLESLIAHATENSRKMLEDNYVRLLVVADSDYQSLKPKFEERDFIHKHRSNEHLVTAILDEVKLLIEQTHKSQFDEDLHFDPRNSLALVEKIKQDFSTQINQFNEHHNQRKYLHWIGPAISAFVLGVPICMCTRRATIMHVIIVGLVYLSSNFLLNRVWPFYLLPIGPLVIALPFSGMMTWVYVLHHSQFTHKMA